MSLNPPDLDDISYEELVEDAIRQIPNLSETWTDHNPSDPGITIIEMLAWIAESEIYHLDQITEDHIRRFLRLLGVEPHRAQSALFEVTVTASGDSPRGRIPDGEKLHVETEAGDHLCFETVSDLVISPASIDAVVTIHHGTRTDHTRANETGSQYYHAFGEDPVVNSGLYLGLDADPFDAVDRLDLTVDFHDDGLTEPAIHGPSVNGSVCPPAYPIPDPENDENGLVPREVATAISDLAEPNPASFEPSVEIRWEYCVEPENWRDPDTWKPLPVIRDETNAFYSGGRIDVAAPEPWDGSANDLFERGEEHYWIRCRITTPGHEVPPQLNAINTNVVRAEHRCAESDVLLESPDGEATTSAMPNQVFEFPDAPIQTATITVGGETWVEVSDTAGSGPDDHHYVLDHEGGRIHFGDGLAGDIPEPGLPVRATHFVMGGGRAGNVTTNAHWQFLDAGYRDLQVGSQKRLRSGRNAETVEAALERARVDLKRPYRAITPADFRTVAEHTPGLRFGRTAVFSTPPSRRLDGCANHGTTHVVVVPESTKPRPMPSPAFLEAVRCHLQQHRLLTDRISVEPPEYVGVSVTTEISIEDGYDDHRRIMAIESTLDDFLDPLGGFDGDGWPFGRPVYPSELYEAIAVVEGIDCVHGVEAAGQGTFERDNGAIMIEDKALVYPQPHEVLVRREGKPCRRWAQ